jgi:hypothetical protein
MLHLLYEQGCIIIRNIVHYIIIRKFAYLQYSYAGGQLKHTQDIPSVKLCVDLLLSKQTGSHGSEFMCINREVGNGIFYTVRAEIL